MIDRIKQFIDYQKISIRSFEKKISASDGMIRRAINNNTDIQSKWITEIADKYPQLNIVWLVTGHGDMLYQDVESISPLQPNDAMLLRELLKEKDAKIEHLSEEIGMLRQKLRDDLGNDIHKESSYRSGIAPSPIAQL